MNSFVFEGCKGETVMCLHDSPGSEEDGKRVHLDSSSKTNDGLTLAGLLKRVCVVGKREARQLSHPSPGERGHLIPVGHKEGRSARTGGPAHWAAWERAKDAVCWDFLQQHPPSLPLITLASVPLPRSGHGVVG